MLSSCRVCCPWPDKTKPNKSKDEEEKWDPTARSWISFISQWPQIDLCWFATYMPFVCAHTVCRCLLPCNIVTMAIWSFLCKKIFASCQLWGASCRFHANGQWLLGQSASITIWDKNTFTRRFALYQLDISVSLSVHALPVYFHFSSKAWINTDNIWWLLGRPVFANQN